MTDTTRSTADSDRGTVVVTGASRGIGFAISSRLVADGYRVVGLARDRARLDAATEELGSAFVGKQVDILDEEGLTEAIAFAAPDLMGLVNNAGIAQLGAAVDLGRDEFLRVMDANVGSVFSACVEAYRAFVAQGRSGSIVNITSIEAFMGHSKMSAYAASKFAVRGLTQALAIEWARDDVRVNSVAPGAVRTDMTSHLEPGSKGYDRLMERTPLRRFSEPSEIAGAVAFLLGDDSTFVTGTHLSVDGGYTA